MGALGVLTRARLLVTHGGSIGSLMDALAQVYGGQQLVEEPEGIRLAGRRTALSYLDAAEVVARASGIVRHRYSLDKPLVVCGTNGYDFFLSCLAVARAGGCFVPVNPQMSADEINHILQDAGGDLLEIEWLVSELEDAGSAPAERLPVAHAAMPWEPACILYTSGTTGRPKGAVLTHRALLDQPSRLLLFPAAWTSSELVAALPVAHIMGFSVLLAAAFAGVPAYSIPHFRPLEVLEAIEKRRSSVFVGVPAMYRLLLDAGAEQRDLTSIQLWGSAADRMPEELAQRFKRMGSGVNLPGLARSIGEAAFADGYGMVELGGLVAARLSPPFTTAGLGDALLVPLPPYRVRVVGEDGREVMADEVGELTVHGPGVLQAYYGDEEATRTTRTVDGWVYTGDLARRASFGLVQLVGRKKDVIKAGGYSVFPAEVEEVLRGHSAVADAAVVGEPDAIRGEVPVAFVELAPGAVTNADELLQWAADRLAEYKSPRRVLIEEVLPRTGTRKIAKEVLRTRLRHLNHADFRSPERCE